MSVDHDVQSDVNFQDVSILIETKAMCKLMETTVTS